MIVADQIIIAVQSLWTPVYYQSMLETNVSKCVQQLKLSIYWITQQDSDTKHSSKRPP